MISNIRNKLPTRFFFFFFYRSGSQISGNYISQFRGNTYVDYLIKLFKVRKTRKQVKAMLYKYTFTSQNSSFVYFQLVKSFVVFEQVCPERI